MIVGTRSKGARSVTNAAILGGRHVVDRFTTRRHTMTRGAVVHETAVIDECISEVSGVMTRSAILDR